MGPIHRQNQDLHAPWDTILGTRSQIRVIRVLERARESMTVREVARRADEHLRATQIAVSRLVESGLVQRVGTGRQQLVRWNPDHPLSPALSILFGAERERYSRVVDSLAQLARTHANSAQSVWMTEHPEVGGSRIEIGILSSSTDLDQLVDALRGGVVSLMRSEDLSVEVRGWTLPDLEISDSPLSDQPGQLKLLWGILPWEINKGDQEKTPQRKSHQMIDAELRQGAERLASTLQRRPELIRLAREEIVRRLERAPSQEARTLREWLQVLEGMRLSKLTRWLVDDSDQAIRLRQSMPLVFLRAVEEDAEQENDR